MMTEQQAADLAAEHSRLEREANKERNRGFFNRTADHYEQRMAKIEAEFQRHDVDINDYRE